jgi:hypothetical protein
MTISGWDWKKDEGRLPKYCSGVRNDVLFFAVEETANDEQ